MHHVEGVSRYQTKLFNLDEHVNKEHVVRIIDRFVDMLDLKGLGFEKVTPADVGRPPYNPRYLLKLYLYGYESGVRSSRKLERLTNESIPAMWLMDGLTPDFKTIADFRKDNIEAITSVFYEYGSFLDSAGGFGKKVVAIDGTKIRACNNKKNNYNRKKIGKRLEHNRQRVEEYMEALDKADNWEEYDAVSNKLDASLAQLKKYEGYLDRLDKAGEDELSVVDHDARLMKNNCNGLDVAYNAQASVDEKNHLVTEFDISQNPTDHDQLASMMEKTQEVLRNKDIIGLADKGYYNGEQLEKCEKAEIVTIVSKQKSPGDKGKDKSFHIDKFVYDPDKDAYTCPLGNVLATRSSRKAKQRKFFNKDACSNCPSKGRCLTGKLKFRMIVRGPHSDAYDRADKRFRENIELYKKRQQTIEHVFGTVKRTMNGGYFLLCTKEKAKCETALLLLGYNIKRSINALGFWELMAKLDEYEKKTGNQAASMRSIFCFFIPALFHIVALLQKYPKTNFGLCANT